MDADAGYMLNDASSDFEEPLPDGYKLGLGEGEGLRNCRAHCVHQPERSRVQYEADLIGRRAVAGCAVGGKLGLVQLDEVLHLTTLAVHGLIQASRMTCQRGHGEADVDLLTHVAGLIRVRLQ